MQTRQQLQQLQQQQKKQQQQQQDVPSLGPALGASYGVPASSAEEDLAEALPEGGRPMG